MHAGATEPGQREAVQDQRPHSGGAHEDHIRIEIAVESKQQKIRDEHRDDRPRELALQRQSIAAENFGHAQRCGEEQFQRAAAPLFGQMAGRLRSEPDLQRAMHKERDADAGRGRGAGCLHKKQRWDNLKKIKLGDILAASSCFPGGFEPIMYPNDFVPSLDILGNVIPFIKDEEAKIETEICKMLGRRSDARIESADIAISAHANRVPVEHGHTVCLSVEFSARASAGAALQVLRDWQGDARALHLPSSPARALVVTDLADRPQPRRDVDAGRGMTVTVGRVRADPLFHVKLVAMGHNTIRGAAGASVLNAEVLVSTGQAGVT